MIIYWMIYIANCNITQVKWLKCSQVFFFNFGHGSLLKSSYHPITSILAASKQLQREKNIMSIFVQPGEIQSKKYHDPFNENLRNWKHFNRNLLP